MPSVSRRQVLAGATSLAIGAGITTRPSAAQAATEPAIAPPPNLSYLSRSGQIPSDINLIPEGGGAPEVVGQTREGFGWSPDSSRIAVVNNRVIESWRPGGRYRFPASFPGGASDNFPIYTPDGRFIIYTRSLTNGQSRLWWSSSDGLWDRGELFPSLAGSLNWPAMHPQGLLAFTVSGESNKTDIYMAWLTELGWTPTRLAVENAAKPAFSPLGNRLAYVSWTGSPQGVWVSELEGSGGFKVSPDSLARRVWQVEWSRDGEHLYVETLDEELARIPARSPGGPVEPLTVTGRAPAFRPVGFNMVNRLWGNLALDTALAVSQSRWAIAGEVGDPRAIAGAVVLSRSDVFYDALAGSALAARKRAPLLITPPTGLYAPTEREIQRVLGRGGLVYLLGGEAALPKHIEDRLKSVGFQVKRLWGATMFETATAIADEITTEPSAVFVATGLEYYDALAAGAAAGSGSWGDAVVILTDGPRMPASSAAYLDKLDPTKVEILVAGGPGNTALVRDAYQGGKLPSWPDEIDYYDLTGATAVETALMVAQASFASPQQVALATVNGWYDALTGGAMIGSRGGPLLLTPSNLLHPHVALYLEESCASIHTAYMLGGPAALDADLGPWIGGQISAPGKWDYLENVPIGRSQLDGPPLRPARNKQSAHR